MNFQDKFPEAYAEFTGAANPTELGKVTKKWNKIADEDMANSQICFGAIKEFKTERSAYFRANMITGARQETHGEKIDRQLKQQKIRMK